MADTATSRKRLRKQSLGSNTNTWGDTKLNEVLDVIDQCMDGYVAVALTGSLDLSAATTNYTAADNTKYRAIAFTGTLGAPATVTFPSVQCWYLIFNTTNQTVTVLCSGGTGVAVPPGTNALVYGDGADLRNAAPQLFGGPLTVNGQIRGVAAGAASTDAVNVAQMAAAIATAALPATAGTILNSVSDTMASYAAQKLPAYGFLKRRTLAAGGNEQQQIKPQRDATVTANTTVIIGAITPVDSSGGAIAALNLPAAGTGDTALQDGDFVWLIDVGGAVESNTVTVVGNAGTINFMGQGAAASLTWNGPKYSMLKFGWNAGLGQWIGNGYD
jgi:hypothetical protein